MQPEGEVKADVIDLITRLTGSDPAAIEPDSSLRDLGVDSLMAVELAEELGRRHQVYISDGAVDGLRTVQDAVEAITRHDGATAPRWTRKLALVSDEVDDGLVDDRAPHDEPIDREKFTSGALLTTITMTVFGVIVGGALGFAAATALDAAGLGAADLPPLASETNAVPEPTDDSSASPEPSASDETDDGSPEPTLTASSEDVQLGDPFVLSGALPSVGEGAELRVQFKVEDGKWTDFAVTTTTGPGGTFTAEVQTSRTGPRQWRLTNADSGRVTPTVTVTIG
ncbi:MAG: acyl carrier protein [Aeromicrobium sp.]|uniref:acyl carrier protein n=1 Tax=Aeromicrobium sp. TaxID=1871063 RepID=UPI0039E260B7